MHSKPTFLVADNDSEGMLSIHTQLQQKFTCTFAYPHSIEKTEEMIRQEHFNILFYDLNFSEETDCIDALKKLHQLNPKTTIIPLIPMGMLHRIKELRTLQHCIHITKPIDLTEITITIHRVLETNSLRHLEEIPTEPDILIEAPKVNWLKGYINFKEVIDEFENTLITQALRITEGNKKAAASILTLKRTTLLEKIKKKGLHNNWREPKD